jgi:hypothetical protein
MQHIALSRTMPTTIFTSSQISDLQRHPWETFVGHRQQTLFQNLKSKMEVQEAPVTKALQPKSRPKNL